MKRTRIAFVAAVVTTLGACAADGTTGADAFGGADAAAEDRQVYLGMVSRIADRGQAQAALAFLDEYELRHPRDADAWSLRGGALLQTGDLAGAEAAFLWLHGKGHRPVADYGLGRVAAARGDWAEAAKNFSKAVELAPSNARYLNNLGYAQLQLGQFDAAYAALARAVQLDPANIVTRNNFILAADRSGRREEVARAMRKLDEGEQKRVSAMIETWNQTATP
jgi:Flp pilus assembly protein TadD